MTQLGELLDRLTAHKNCEAAAERDVADREHDLRAAEESVRKAMDRLNEAHLKTEDARIAVHVLIEARTHSMFEGERG